MIFKGPHINLMDLLSCFSEALDLIDSSVANHPYRQDCEGINSDKKTKTPKLGAFNLDY